MVNNGFSIVLMMLQLMVMYKAGSGRTRGTNTTLRSCNPCESFDVCDLCDLKRCVLIEKLKIYYLLTEESSP